MTIMTQVTGDSLTLQSFLLAFGQELKILLKNCHQP